MIFNIPLYVIALLVAGALGPLAIVPFIPELEWPPDLKYLMYGISAFLIAYACYLLSWKLVVSEEGLAYSRLDYEFRWSWDDIAEWRFDKGPDWHFRIRDQNGEQHELRWILFSAKRGRQLAEILSKKGVPGENVDAG